MIERLFINPRRSFKATGKDRWIIEEHRLPYGVNNGKAFSAGNHVYLFGGEISEAGKTTDKILHTTLDSDGNLAPWETLSTKLPYSSSTNGFYYYNNRVYLVGGWSDDATFRGTRDTTMSCDINPDGTLGTWRIETPKLPVAVGRFSHCLIENVIWIFGGWTGREHSRKCYYSVINPDGTIGNWTTDKYDLRENVYQSPITVSGNYVYIKDYYEIKRRRIRSGTDLGAWESVANVIYYDRELWRGGTLTIADKTSFVSLWDNALSAPSTAETFFDTVNGELDLNSYNNFSGSLPIAMYESGITVSSQKALLIGGQTVELDPNLEQLWSPEPTSGFDHRVQYKSELPDKAEQKPIQVPPGENISRCDEQWSPYPLWCLPDYDRSLVGTKYLVREDDDNEGHWVLYEISGTGAGGVYRFTILDKSVKTRKVTWTPEPTSGFQGIVEKRSDLEHRLPGTLNVPPGKEEWECQISPMPPWCNDYTYDTSSLGQTFLIRKDNENFDQWTIVKSTSSTSNGYIVWTIQSKAEKQFIGDVERLGTYVLSARLLFDKVDSELDLGPPSLSDEQAGPGPKQFKEFDEFENVGLFGEVTANELISYENFKNLMNFGKGQVNSQLDIWIKAWIDNKVIYFPKEPITKGISYDDLDSANLVDGSKTVLIKNKEFNVRLFNGMNPGNNKTLTASGFDDPLVHRSEWNRVIYRLVTDLNNNKKESQNRDNLESYTQREMFVGDSPNGINILEGTQTICKSINPQNRSEIIIRGGDNVTKHLSIKSDNNGLTNGWRPVLEFEIPRMAYEGGVDPEPDTPGFNIPDGPGPKDFIGVDYRDNCGFFGEISTNDLISPVELADKLDINYHLYSTDNRLLSNSIINESSPWLKFWIDGKIIYIAKKPIMCKVSFDTLMKANVTDGSKVINIKGNNYKIRFPIGADDSKFGHYYGNDSVKSVNSEWNRLIYRVAKQLGTAADERLFQNGPNWVEYPQDSSENGLGLSGSYGGKSYCTLLEKDEYESTSFLTRGSTQTVTYIDLISKTASSKTLEGIGWRPVLELTNLSEGYHYEGFHPGYDTGPGRQAIPSHWYDPDDDTGFFGEVASKDFIAGNSFINLIGMTLGRYTKTQNSNTPWLKFYIDGKVIFSPKKTIAYDMMSSVLLPAFYNGSKVVTIKGYKFKVRLWESLESGANIRDVGITGGTQYNPEYTHNSEWNRLIYRVAKPLETAEDDRTGQRGPNWVEYPQDNTSNGLGLNSSNGGLTICLEGGSSGAHIRRGLNTVSRFTYGYIGGTNYGYRPVLELIP